MFERVLKMPKIKKNAFDLTPRTVCTPGTPI